MIDAVEVSGGIDQLRAHQNAICLHLAAQQVVRAGLHGGEGSSFRIDNITPELAEQLPGYLELYTDRWFPNIYFDDQGNIQPGGSTRVDGRHTRPVPKDFWVNEVSGEPQGWFTFGPTDEVVPEIAQSTPPTVENNRTLWERLSKRCKLAIMGVSLTSQLLGIGLMVKGEALQSSTATTMTSSDEEGQRLVNLGMGILGANLIVGVGGTLLDVRRFNQLNKSKGQV